MKNKKYLFMLLASLIAFCLMFLAACQPPDIPSEDDPEEPDDVVVSDGLLVSNGFFSNIGTANSSQKYLKSSVPGWTAVNGAKEINTTGIVMGVIDLEINSFNNNKTSLISDFNDYPGLGISTKYDPEKGESGDWEDTNALVIGIPSTLDKGSVYFTSGEITVEKDNFYALNIDVYTDLIKDVVDAKSGAAICLTDGVFAEYISIDTNKTWNKYNFYIKGNGFEDRKFKIQLWLGHGPQNNGTTPNPHLAAGVVLFDNVVLEKIDETEYNEIAENIEIQETVITTIEGVQNINTRIDLAYPDPALMQYSPYDATSKYSGSTMYYYSAKKGTTPNYNFIVGGNELTSADRESFPIYTTTKTDTFPVGVFDMSKFYSFVNDTPSNTYGTIYTSSGGFKAPDYQDFYKKTGDQWGFSLAGSNGLTGRAEDSSNDTNALLVYHPNNAISGAGYKSKSKLQIEKNTYYKISVWVYIWIPEMTEPAMLTGDDLSDPVKVAAYEEKKAAYDRYFEFYNKDRDVSATFRVSGASVSQDSSLEAKSTGWGTWQELSIKIKGNELSERQLNFEFWYGEGKWDSDSLYPGACLFDDIKITKYDDETIVAAGEDSSEYYQLSILQEGDFKYFGLIDTPVSLEAFTYLEDANSLWSHDLADQRTSNSSYSVGILGGQNEFINSTGTSTVEGLDGLTEGPKTISVKYNNVLTPHDVFMINHIQPTASSAKFIIEEEDIAEESNLESLLQVNPNSFYRLSMWVKTAGILKGKGASVSVFAGSSTSATAQYTGINSDEWIELALYIQGRSVTSERLNISVTLGSGDIFTPDSHIQGAFFMTAMTWQKITYEEHKNADTTQTNVKKQTLSETTGGTTSAITNGFFTNIETANYDNSDLFDANGNLKGTATPSNWNKTEAKTTLSKPALKISDDHSKLTWDPVDKAEYYYVFMNKYSDDGEIKDNVMIARYYADTSECPISYNGSYYIRALGGINSQNQMFSAPSSVVTATKIEGGIKPSKYEGVDKDIFTIKMGIINYLYYEDFDADDKNNMYGDPSQGYYKSTSSNNLLIISSELDTYTGYTMASSHTVYKNKYYVISVWVRTLEGAKASITLKNPSSALALKEYSDSNFEVNGEYIGFVNIDTAEEWTQYRMLINSTLADGRISIELFMGNQYAEEISSGEGDDDIRYSQGLSRGTVLFDDVNIKELTSKEAYNLEAYGFADPTSVDETEWLEENKTNLPYSLSENSAFTGLLYNNNYIFKIMDFTVDSFDNYTDATDDYIGHAPGAYNHKDAQEAKSYSTPTEEAIPAMLYGVYSDRQLTEKVYDYLSGIGFSKEEIETYLATGTNGNGRYFLMMANIEDNGQYYEQKTGFEAEADAYYEIKFSAKLLAESGNNAEFRFIYGNDTTKWSTISINGTSMTEYKFYVHNEDTESAVSSNKISFHIGTNDGIVGGNDTKNFFKGILIIDDVSIIKMPSGEDTETAYAAIESENKYSFAAAVEEPEPEDPEDEDETTEKPKVDPQIWLLIASIVIGAMLLVTIIVLIARRIGKRMTKNKKVVIQSKVPVSGIPQKKNEGKDKGRKELQESDIDKFND